MMTAGRLLQKMDGPGPRSKVARGLRTSRPGRPGETLKKMTTPGRWPRKTAGPGHDAPRALG
eukprot:13154459-Alexandrium_andersonii.AAC.1